MTRVIPALLVVGLAAMTGSVAAWNPPAVAPATQNVDLAEFPKLEPKDLPARHREWIEKDVVWIITPQEREVYLRLDTDAKRDLFIREFWNQRDPSPGSERNEYRELHYERIEHATDTFGRETPRQGWQTDRGRMYILLGEPRSTSRLPNTSNTVPVEVWFYAVDPALGLPPFFYLIFFRDNGVGEYRLYSPAIDGPKKLLNAGAQMAAARGDAGGMPTGITTGFSSREEAAAVNLLRQSDQELASAAVSLIPGDGIGLGVSPLRSEMVLSRIFDLPNRLMPRPVWSYRVLAGVAESSVRFETLPFAAAAAVIVDPSGVPFLHFVTRTTGDELNLNNYQDEYYLTFDVGSSLRDRELRFLQNHEPKTLQANLDAERARSLRGGPVEYMERHPVLDGSYVLDLIMENNVTREFGRTEIAVEVPAPGGPEPWAGQPFLLFESRDLGDAYDPFAPQYPFQVGSWVLIPGLDGPYAEGGNVQVFWQLYLPARIVEPFLASFELRDAAGQTRIAKRSRIDPDRRDRQGILNHLVDIDLTGLPPGEYSLYCELEQPAGPEVRLPLRVVEAAEFQRPFVHALALPPPTAPEVGLERAEQLRTVGRTAEAIDLLTDVLERDPERAEALRLQVELLTDAGRLRELDDLLEPRLARAPADLELLMKIAEVKAQLGEHYDAIRYFERARIAGAEDTAALLNALASEYYAEGRRDRARELLEQSLQLEPDQPQIRRLLDELLRDAG